MRDVRACAATGALQADTATPLLRCARCRSTHYVDAARQRAHWPAHRRTCLPLGDGEKERVANLKAPRAFAELAGDLRAGGSARTVRCCAVPRRAGPGAPPGDFEATCHGAARAFARASDATAALLAAPGLAAYLLCGDDCRRRRRARRAPPGSRGACPRRTRSARGDATPRARAAARVGGRRPRRGPPPSRRSTSPGRRRRRAARGAARAAGGRRARRARAGALAAACRARVLGLWGDVAARECGGDAFAAAPGSRAAAADGARGGLRAVAAPGRGAARAQGPVVCAALADLADAAAPGPAAGARAAVRRAAVPAGGAGAAAEPDARRLADGRRAGPRRLPGLLGRRALRRPRGRLRGGRARAAGRRRRRRRPGALVDDAAQRPRAASAARRRGPPPRADAAAGAHRAGLVGRPGDDDGRGPSSRACCAPRRRAYPALAAPGARGCCASRRSAPSSAAAPCGRLARTRTSRARRGVEATPWPRTATTPRPKLACAELAAGRPRRPPRAPRRPSRS